MSTLKNTVAILLSLTLIICITNGASAASSSNIPLGSYIYVELERLELKGLIKSGILSSKPFSRIEGARLIREAVIESETPEFRDKSGYQAILERLKHEFAPELRGPIEAVNVTPLESGYVTFLHSSMDPAHITNNNNGDKYFAGKNALAAFTSKAAFYDTVTVVVEPQTQLNNVNSEIDLLNAYGLFDVWGIELEIGRDSLWWGSGENGALIISNNAQPFNMVKLTSTESFELPWIFKYLGQFKPVVFYSNLGTDYQTIPNTEFCGLRLDFKPFQEFQFGLSRTMMFGGDGRATMGLTQWWNAWWVNPVQEHYSTTYNNKQYASMDAAFTYTNQTSFLPFSGIRIYTEWGAVDSRSLKGNTGTVVNPDGFAFILGALIDQPANIEGLDLRIEVGDTAMNARYSLWYSAGVYTTGYTNMGRVIGDAMGGNSENLYIRGQYHLDNGAVFGIEYEGVSNGIWPVTSTYTPYNENNSVKLKTDWFGGDISYPISEYLTLQGGIGYETMSSTITNQKGIAIWTTLRLMHI